MDETGASEMHRERAYRVVRPNPHARLRQWRECEPASAQAFPEPVRVGEIILIGQSAMAPVGRLGKSFSPVRWEDVPRDRVAAASGMFECPAWEQGTGNCVGAIACFVPVRRSIDLRNR